MALKRQRGWITGLLGAGILGAWIGSITTTARTEGHVSSAISPVVYPLDESSSEHGDRYIFFGNAFFVDEDGYLITAAHVLTDLHGGGQPHALMRLPEAPPRLVKMEVIATDPQHDVAILRAVPNPFTGRYVVSSLALAANGPPQGSAVVAEALRPGRMQDPRTFDSPQEDRSAAEVLQYISFQLGRDQPKGELFLFSHEVIRGQSGAPVLSRDTGEVVGVVEGQWLHSSPLSSVVTTGKGEATLGAAVPIGYALELLKQNHISWHNSP